MPRPIFSTSSAYWLLILAADLPDAAQCEDTAPVSLENPATLRDSPVVVAAVHGYWSWSSPLSRLRASPSSCRPTSPDNGAHKQPCTDATLAPYSQPEVLP
jgi:hypothetical protein